MGTLAVTCGLHGTYCHGNKQNARSVLCDCVKMGSELDGRHEKLDGQQSQKANSFYSSHLDPNLDPVPEHLLNSTQRVMAPKFILILGIDIKLQNTHVTTTNTCDKPS